MTATEKRPSDDLVDGQQKYSYTWGMAVWRKMCESYPRATNIFALGFIFQDRTLARLIASGSPWWAQIRTLIHQIDRWDRRQARVGPIDLKSALQTATICGLVLNLRHQNLDECLFQALTKRILGRTIQEQSFQGEADFLSASPCLIQGVLFEQDQ